MNNLIQGKGSPAERLEWLLQWAKARWPGTRFGVVALTPHNWDNSRLVGPTNKQYRAMATRQGAAWIECCQDWSPSNAGLYGDGLHFTPKGNDRLVQCLRAGAGKLLSP